MRKGKRPLVDSDEHWRGVWNSKKQKQNKTPNQRDVELHQKGTVQNDTKSLNIDIINIEP